LIYFANRGPALCSNGAAKRGRYLPIGFGENISDPAMMRQNSRDSAAPKAIEFSEIRPRSKYLV